MLRKLCAKWTEPHKVGSNVLQGQSPFFKQSYHSRVENLFSKRCPQHAKLLNFPKTLTPQVETFHGKPLRFGDFVGSGEISCVSCMCFMGPHSLNDGRCNQIGPSESALGDDLHSTVGNSTKHLTSDACLHEWMRHGMERCGWCRPPSN